MAAKELTAGQTHNPHLVTSNGEGVIYVDHNGTNVYLHASPNGVNWLLVESFSADTVKKLTLAEHFRLSGSSTDSTNNTVGNARMWIDPTLGG